MKKHKKLLVKLIQQLTGQTYLEHTLCGYYKEKMVQIFGKMIGRNVQ